MFPYRTLISNLIFLVKNDPKLSSKFVRIQIHFEIYKHNYHKYICDVKKTNFPNVDIRIGDSGTFKMQDM